MPLLLFAPLVSGFVASKAAKKIDQETVEIGGHRINKTVAIVAAAGAAYLAVKHGKKFLK